MLLSPRTLCRIIIGSRAAAACDLQAAATHEYDSGLLALCEISGGQQLGRRGGRRSGVRKKMKQVLVYSAQLLELLHQFVESRESLGELQNPMEIDSHHDSHRLMSHAVGFHP